MTRLVLLPGLDGTGALFRPLIARRPPGVDVHTIDYEQLHAASYEDHCEHVASALPPDDFFVLGWSFSGPLALMLGARQVPGLRGVILVGSFAWRPLRHVPGWLTPLARPSLLALYPIASMAQALLLGYSTPELRALQREAFSRVSAKSLAARAQMVLGVDVRRELGACAVPILYLRAKDDRLIHRGHGEMIVKEARDATLVDVPGPHLCLVTHPDDAWTAILPFLSVQPSLRSA